MRRTAALQEEAPAAEKLPGSQGAQEKEEEELEKLLGAQGAHSPELALMAEPAGQAQESLRTRWLFWSEMMKVLLPAAEMPLGAKNRALVPAPSAEPCA